MHKDSYTKKRSMKESIVKGRFSMPYGRKSEPHPIKHYLKFAKDFVNNKVPSKEEIDSHEYLSTNADDVTNLENFYNSPADPDTIKYIWLGHSTVLVRMNDFVFITDPVLSHSCAPKGMELVSKLFGYYRKCRLPYNTKDKYELIEKMSVLHAVFISHDHNDHLNLPTLKALYKRFGDALTFFTFSNYKAHLGCKSVGIKNVIEFSWMETKRLVMYGNVVNVTTENDVNECYEVMGLPAQHWCGTNLHDKNVRLWGSWLVKTKSHDKEKSFYFAGDTGYGEYGRAIAEVQPSIDLAAIPIGAYEPRAILKTIHLDPNDAIRLHKDIRAKKSVAIHWGTFVLANEHFFQPPLDLMKGLIKFKLSEEDFAVLRLGQLYTQ